MSYDNPNVNNTTSYDRGGLGNQRVDNVEHPTMGQRMANFVKGGPAPDNRQYPGDQYGHQNYPAGDIRPGRNVQGNAATSGLPPHDQPLEGNTAGMGRPRHGTHRGYDAGPFHDNAPGYGHGQGRGHGPVHGNAPGYGPGPTTGVTGYGTGHGYGAGPGPGAGVGPGYGAQKPTIGDRMMGATERAAGKLTGDADVYQRGVERSSGVDQARRMQGRP